MLLATFQRQKEASLSNAWVQVSDCLLWLTLLPKTIMAFSFSQVAILWTLDDSAQHHGESPQRCFHSCYLFNYQSKIKIKASGDNNKIQESLSHKRVNQRPHTLFTETVIKSLEPKTNTQLEHGNSSPNRQLVFGDLFISQFQPSMCPTG